MQILAGGLGGREAILIAGIVLLMVGVSVLLRLEKGASGDEGLPWGGDEAPARAYLDRLVGPARNDASAAGGDATRPATSPRAAGPTGPPDRPAPRPA